MRRQKANFSCLKRMNTQHRLAYLFVNLLYIRLVSPLLPLPFLTLAFPPRQPGIHLPARRNPMLIILWQVPAPHPTLSTQNTLY